MGFGWLFLGYFFANMMPDGSPLSFAKLIGYPLMIVGFYKLAAYHPRFRYCFYASFATVPFAVYYGMYGLARFGVFELFPFLSGTFYTVVDTCYLAVTLLLNALLLWAVAALTGELKLLTLQSSAWRNLIFVGIYYLLRVVMALPFPIQKYLIGPTLLLWLVTLFLILFLLFKCYRYICPEGDEAMPELPARHKKKDVEKKEEETE